MDLTQNYYLDINKVSKLEKTERKVIYQYYRDMIYAMEDKRTITAVSLYNTLSQSGFLKDRDVESRDEKIDSILNENNG